MTTTTTHTEFLTVPICSIAGRRCTYGDGPGPADIDSIATNELIAWAHPTAVYTCGTSSGGSSITCIDAQRLPSLQQADAVTFGHYVFCQDRCRSDRLLAHEFVHVTQYEINGDAMAISYLVQSALNGYRDNPYEVEAYNVQGYLRANGWGG